MLTSLSVILALGAHLFIPGLSLAYLLGLEKHRFLLPFSLGLAIIVLSQLPFRFLESTIFSWLVTFYLVSGSLTIAAFLKSGAPTAHSIRSLGKIGSWAHFNFFCITVGYGIYHIIVGPYTEIPSDFWQHLARIQAEIQTLDVNATSNNLRSFTSVFHQTDQFYVLIALLAVLTKTSALSLAPSVAFFFSLTFLAAIYFFTLDLARRTPLPNVQINSIAVLSTLLTGLWLGTATFAYVRYYAFFPTMLNFALFYSSIIIFLDHTSEARNKRTAIALLPFLFLTMVIIHIQEALFFIVMVSGILFWKFARILLDLEKVSNYQYRLIRSWTFFAGLMWLGLIFYALFFREMNVWGHTPHVVDAGAAFSLQFPIPIANPKFRFWDTLAPFGVIVFIWYLVERRRFRYIDYLNVGMLSPLFTVFNPAYAWLFLHYGSSTTLWRTTYLMPLGIVAAFLIISTLSASNGRRQLFKKSRSFLFSCALVVSLLPLSIGELENRNSRLPSFANVSKHSGTNLWGDLITEVKRLQETHQVRNILTDQVTKFVLYSAIRGEIRHWLDKEYFPAHNLDYQKDLISSDFTRHLLIINKRDGQLTRSSTLSGHWSPTILATSHYYPDQIDQFIAKNKQIFELLWEQDRVSIYLVHFWDD